MANMSLLGEDPVVGYLRLASAGFIVLGFVVGAMIFLLH